MKFARIPSAEISYLPLDMTDEPLPAMVGREPYWAETAAGRRAATAAIVVPSMTAIYLYSLLDGELADNRKAERLSESLQIE